MSISQVDLNIPGGMYLQRPELVTTTLVGKVESKLSLALYREKGDDQENQKSSEIPYLLYIRISGVQIMFGGKRRSFTLPYSDSFHLFQMTSTTIY